MDKNEIQKLYAMRKEKEDLERKIRKLQTVVDKIVAEGNVTDSVAGGKGGKDHFVITGFPIPEYEKNVTLLSERKFIYENLLLRIDESINLAESYLASVDDSLTRQIARYRCCDGKSWREIAMLVGGNNTEDSVRMMFTRAFEE